jgi:hypothetical protein
LPAEDRAYDPLPKYRYRCHRARPICRRRVRLQRSTRQALDALGPASEHAGRDLPARPETLPVAADERTAAATETSVELTAEDLPDAASHGAAVSDAAKPADPPADSDHGKTVSEVARDNNGAAAVEEHKPADAGKPDSAGKPADPGPPDTVVTLIRRPTIPVRPPTQANLLIRTAELGEPLPQIQNPARHPPTGGLLAACP